MDYDIERNKYNIMSGQLLMQVLSNPAMMETFSEAEIYKMIAFVNAYVKKEVLSGEHNRGWGAFEYDDKFPNNYDAQVEQFKRTLKNGSTSSKF